MRTLTIALIAAIAAVGNAQVKVTEKAVPGAGRICIQAVVKLPPMSPREWGALLVIKDSLRAGTKAYTRLDLLNYATVVGEPIQITLAADHVRIGFSMPAANLTLASNVLLDLLDKCAFHEEEIVDQIGLAEFKRPGAWEQALSPWRADFSKLSRNDLIRVYRRVFRPESTTVAIEGDLTEGAAVTEFTDRFKDWKPENPGRMRVLEGTPSKPFEGHPVTTTSLAAHLEKPPAELLLTAFALGVGKGASAFRIVREGQGLSYRQEAVLSPAEKGWRVALQFQNTKTLEPADLDKLKETLKKDIESWDAATLTRAAGMAEACFDLGVGAVPIYLDPRRPLFTSLEDQTYWRAYSLMKLGTPSDYESLRSQMATVPLESLKETAKEWIEKASFETSN